jgi:acetyl-CoA C-acetyltransferase
VVTVTSVAMALDPRTPVLVGVGVAHQREGDPGAGLDTTQLIVESARLAVADSGAPGLGSRVGWIGATRGLSNLPAAAIRVATALGADAHTVAANVGIPQQTLINRALNALQAAATDIAIVCGGETKYRDDVARRAGVDLAGHDQEGLTPDVEMMPEGEIVARPEIEIGMVAPVQQYAIIDSARRAAEGWTLDEHRTDIATIWNGFNQVARGFARADFGDPMSIEDIRDPSPTNRPIAFPYNKWHNSQWGVDQAAAMVFCTVAVAEEMGVPRDRWVFPHVGLESSLSLSLSRRAELHRWPAMRVLGEAAASHIGRPISDIDHVELYSCFPVAVRVQQKELGLDPTRVPTLTGGMAFAGGPFNSFVFQALVAMAERLRSDAGSWGAVSAVSGLLTKPALAVWSTEPPANGLLVADLVEEASAATAVAPLDENPDGEGVVASYTVIYAGTDPARVCAIVDLDSGDRAVAAVDDPDLAVQGAAEELIGTRVRVTGRALSV